MKCNKCHKLIEDDSKFCEHCGAKIEKTTVSAKHADKVEVSELSTKIIDHLEFLGFEVGAISSEKGVDSFLAKHPDKSNLFIKNIPDFGLSIVSFYTLDEKKIAKSKDKYLEILNTLNSGSLLCTYSCSPENTLVISSWLPAHYDKKEFSHFLDAYEGDIRRQFNTPGLRDYA